MSGDRRPDGAPTPLAIALVAPSEPTAELVESWREASPGSQVFVVRGEGDLRDLLEDLADDQPVVVADAATTPGPAVVERLLAAAATADVIDARVLPVDLAPGPEADMTAELASVAAGEVGPRVNGVCVLATAAAAVRVVAVLGAPRDRSTGQALRAALDAAGLTVAVEVRATVVRHSVLSESDAASVSRETAPVGEPPATTHPALLPATAIHQFLDAAGVAVVASDDTSGERPFLSVVTRTQGRRRRSLEDVLACLAAQADQDFEWVIACHRLDPEQLASVREVVALAPLGLADRIRLVEVHRPGRSAPLNDGFAAARGRYISVLDDDDTVAPNWVRTFHDLEGMYAGTVLRSVAVRQSVVPHVVDGDTVALPVGNPRQDWPDEFDALAHLRHNETPPLSLAFPRGVFHALGIRYDETLDVVEDWDFLVRTAGLVGVRDSRVATSVYHWWLGGETSRSVHDEHVWEAARQRVLDGFADSYFLVAGSATRGLLEALSSAQQKVAELETSQHEVIVQLADTAQEHQVTVDNLLETAEQVTRLTKQAARLEERAAKHKERLVTVRARSARHLELLKKIDERLRVTGAERPESLYELTPKELEALLEGLEGVPEKRPRFRLGPR